MVIFSIIFAVFLKVQPPTGHPSGLHSFALFLLCGLLPWNFFSIGTTASMGSLIANSNLIKKVYFPREILVASTVAAVFVAFCVEMAVLGAVLLFFGNMVLPWIPVVIVIMLIEAVFVGGIGLVLSVIDVYFRDTEHFMGIAMQALFYSAPIVYPISYVPKTADVLGMTIPLRRIYELNPLVTFVESFRSALYDLSVSSDRRPRVPRGVGGGVAGVRALGVREARASVGGGAVSPEIAIAVKDVGKKYRPVLRAEPVAQGVVHAATPREVRRVLGAPGHLLRGAEWYHVRAHRRERIRKEHVAEVHCPDPQARVG